MEAVCSSETLVSTYLRGVATQKTSIYIFAAVRTQNLKTYGALNL
jgi:hypothetical protein